MSIFGKKKLILAIETSCDETAVSVLCASKNWLKIISNEVSSQVKLHAKWGGVVPNLAAREHIKNIAPLFELSLRNAAVSMKDIDIIAVTQGPGLIPALMIGNNFAKTLSYLWEKPLLGIHHIEGHIYSNFIGKSKFKVFFPVLCLAVSGGHTQLVLMKNHLDYEIVGQTLDDAAGEAFDKVARILNIGYPGGPAIASWATKSRDFGSKFKIKLPRPMINKNNFNFSFSGLKTAVLYETKKNPDLLKNKKYIADICNEFQQSIIDVLTKKTLRAAEKYRPRTIMLAGGVSANKELRKQLGKAIKKYMPDVLYRNPDIKLTGDNSAMIAAAAAIRWQKISKSQRKESLNAWKKIQPDANLRLK